MDRAEYDSFTDELSARAAADERVIGLVALGSMAARDYLPDRWSDHDFFLIAHADHAEAMRRDLAWLPRPSRIVFALRETAHGWKVLYDGGHLIEFAVFSPGEVTQAKAGRSRILLDRGGVAGMIDAISDRVVPDPSVDVRYEIGMMATNLLVGVGRHRRGERLSGHQFVTAHALGHLLRALVAHPGTDAGLLDGLDTRRRVERAHPAIGAELGSLLERPVPDVALGLLALARREFGTDLPGDVLEAMTVIERTITGE